MSDGVQILRESMSFPRVIAGTENRNKNRQNPYSCTKEKKLNGVDLPSISVGRTTENAGLLQHIGHDLHTGHLARGLQNSWYWTEGHWEGKDMHAWDS